jgi:hypothetical protein
MGSESGAVRIELRLLFPASRPAAMPFARLRFLSSEEHSLSEVPQMKRLISLFLLSFFMISSFASAASARPYHVKPHKAKRHKAVKHY